MVGWSSQAVVGGRTGWSDGRGRSGWWGGQTARNPRTGPPGANAEYGLLLGQQMRPGEAVERQRRQTDMLDDSYMDLRETLSTRKFVAW